MFTVLATVGTEFHREIVHSGRLSAFVFFIFLLGTFGFIRTSTWMIKKQVSWWPGNVEVGGTHVHHLVWGIFAMMIFGYVGVVHQPGSPWWEIVTAFFAIGMGLALDEFALWLELKDVYWEKDGRKSVDAMIIAGCAAGGPPGRLLLMGDARGLGGERGLPRRRRLRRWSGSGSRPSTRRSRNSGGRSPRWCSGRLGIVPAFRLAKPHSLWARLFYKDERKRLCRDRYPDAGAAAGGPAATPGPEPSPSGSGSAPSAS